MESWQRFALGAIQEAKNLEAGTQVSRAETWGSSLTAAEVQTEKINGQSNFTEGTP